MSGHTPGPWRVEDEDHGAIWIASDNAMYGDIADLYHLFGKDVIRKGDCEANAHLIAAAPDLLEALKGLMVFYKAANEDSFVRFERLADEFKAETGYIRPGKDCVRDSPEERERAWNEWVDAKIDRARAAIAKAEGGE